MSRFFSVRAAGSVLVRGRFGFSSVPVTQRVVVPKLWATLQHRQKMSPLMTEPAFKKSTMTYPDPIRGRHDHGWVHPAERSLAASPGKERLRLCDDNHSTLKAHEATWQAARFGGYQPDGLLLWEIRYCAACQSSVMRPVKFTVALLHVLEHLCSQQPCEVYVHAASTLGLWAQSQLPAQLGVSTAFLTQAHPEADAASAVARDWRTLGQELRQRREQAGLTRRQLGSMAGVADSTIRNYETGRHRPTRSTLRRIVAVPVLRTASFS